MGEGTKPQEVYVDLKLTFDASPLSLLFNLYRFPIFTYVS